MDLRNFTGWILFNLYTGNNDSHAKNLSIFHTPEAGVRLTPFYDLMCTRLYPACRRSLHSLSAVNIRLMARSLGVQPQFETARRIVA